MTCIAVRGGIMAADTQMTLDDQRLRVKKLRRLEDGSVFGGAGDSPAIAKIERWIIAGLPKRGRPRIKETQAVEILLLKHDGTVWYIGPDLEPEKLEGEFSAIGTGGPYALGAMAISKRCGAERAVRVAARFDTNTSEPIETMAILDRQQT